MGPCLQLSAQVKKSEQDSTQLYNRIEKYSSKHSFIEQIHKLVFRSTVRKPKKVPSKKIELSYKEFENKIIRNIIIDTRDPFGFSFTDSTKTANNWLEKTGNQIHIKSKRLAISNFLFLKEGQPLDTLLLAESARLLRAQSYIREVEISPKFVSQSQDSVDIIVLALDSWSITPKVSLSSSQTKLRLRERNFIGLGHEFKIGFSKRTADGKDGYQASYTIPNFKNTFISAVGSYESDYDGYYEKTLAIDRIFYSPFTDWAGGLFLQERYLGTPLQNDTLAFIAQNLKFITQDYWAGHSFRIFKGNTERERTTNLIVSARTLFVDYTELPNIEYDRIRFFSDEKTYLGSVGIASRQFIEDSYIFSDGITEDVPVGIIYSVTGGIQNKNQFTRVYLGAKASYGNYLKIGFLSINFEMGSFFKNSTTEQTTYSFHANYFSNLLLLGSKWKMRQFIKPQVVIGINRLKSVADRVSLNENPDFNSAYGNLYSDTRNGYITGFDGRELGTKKYVLALQTQFYSPWELLGFRVNPFVNITAGLLANTESKPQSKNLYSSFGIGFIVRNDYLVFNSFQFSLIYYPQIPGQDDNIIKTNAFENDDFGFQDFQIGKPRTVIYN